MEGKLGAVHLRAGDALLVLTDTAFAERWQTSPGFAVVGRTEIDDGRDAGPYRWVTLGTLAAMVLLAATGVLSIVHAVLLACSVLVGTHAIRFRQALDALDRDVLLIVASAIGLGTAVERSGLAGAIGAAIGGVAADGGLLVALLAVVLGTLLLTELVTNVAAAALMVPIALECPHGWAPSRRSSRLPSPWLPRHRSSHRSATRPTRSCKSSGATVSATTGGSGSRWRRPPCWRPCWWCRWCGGEAVARWLSELTCGVRRRGRASPPREGGSGSRAPGDARPTGEQAAEPAR